MSEPSLNISITYRREVLSKLFDCIKGTESLHVVGAASMGKTRLLDFLEKPGVQEYYLQETFNQTAIIRVDLNRLVSKENLHFSFFELMLSSLVLEFSKPKYENLSLRQELTVLDTQVIQKQDPLLAVRFLELAVSKICQSRDYKICFLFDEFDDAYRDFPRELFSILRGIRDANKPYLCYALFLRHLPEVLRASKDIESFYELLFRNMIGLGPYTTEDTIDIIHNLEARRGHHIPAEYHEWLAKTSGGHIGIVQALLSILIDNPDAPNHLDDIEWFACQEIVVEECRKILEGLTDDEKAGLMAAVRSDIPLKPGSTSKILYAKGLIKRETNICFSPLFERYIQDL